MRVADEQGEVAPVGQRDLRAVDRAQADPSRAACANSIEPETESWSVSASAVWPRSSAAATSSSGCEAPSRNEKAEWQWSSTYDTNTCSHDGRTETPPQASHGSVAVSQRSTGAICSSRSATQPTKPGPDAARGSFHSPLT